MQSLQSVSAFEENVSLIREINDLRREINALKHERQAQELANMGQAVQSNRADLERRGLNAKSKRLKVKVIYLDVI